MADRSDAYGWDEEDAYWTANYRNRPYASSNPRDYGYYRPAYRYGYEAAGRYQGRKWEEVESDLVTQGYVVEDVRDAPDRPGREFVFVARRRP